ncbi:MAG: C1 family peptidase [Bacteroidota bacterium]
MRIPKLRDEAISILLIALLFSAIPLHAQVIPINQTFSSDTILTPFSGSTPVYSVNISGGVNLLSDSSLVRVVLIDTYGNHYMIFESYPLITHENAYDTLHASDETTFLDGVICDSLRIDIISAFLNLDSLKLDTAYISNAPEMQAQAKWDHDSIKIAIMNQRIVEEHMYWRAGRTSITSMSFEEKYRLLGDKYNWVGFDYYIGGIYEFIHKRVSGNPITNVVGSFDWRFRHGATNPESPYYDGDPNETGWLTPLEDQSVCGSCWAFTSSHTIADYCNLFFSDHLDFD